MAGVAEESAAPAVRADVIRKDNLRCRFQRHIETGVNLLEAIDPVIDLLPEVERLARSDRIHAVLEQLFAGPARLFKDKLIFKPAGTNGYAMHQDFIDWPGFPRSFTTVVVAIDEGNVENGCIEIFRGYHRTGPLSPLDGDYHDLPDDLFEHSRAVNLELRPGDAAVFGCFVPHRSSPNHSSRPRRHLYMSYNRASDGDLRASHYRDFHSWLRRKYAQHGIVDRIFR
jgi:ectoine hydroxylase-related dioxygenase (phytanoyl-CoA dioxygenase family)